MVGTFAGRIDARLLAEGVEREGELAALAGLKVPLGQGYHLGRPARPWAPITETAEHVLLSHRANSGGATLPVPGEPGRHRDCAPATPAATSASSASRG